jgi:hypothetical protein
MGTTRRVMIEFPLVAAANQDPVDGGREAFSKIAFVNSYQLITPAEVMLSIPLNSEIEEGFAREHKSIRMRVVANAISRLQVGAPN